MIPAVGAGVTNGVIEVQLGIPAANSDDTLRAAAKTELSNMGVDYRAIADHVVMCIPDGSTMNGIAYAFIHSWESVYNDEWCDYPSGQMHEIGHNLGLAHSNENGNEYNDQSGMMVSTTTPCYAFVFLLPLFTYQSVSPRGEEPII